MKQIDEKITFTIGQVSDLKKISAYTLRYYDKQGLLPKVIRDKNGTRHFTKEDLQWLDMIKCLKNTSMSLDQIKDFVDSTYQGQETLDQRLDLLKGQVEKIKRTILEQQSYIKQINKKINVLKREKGSEI
ncbi:MerR family transcriptional regulator [Liquorilactobacillus mali]|uniref:MerR family transcriptional regulator n=1 Tax=Liquorilactobacillus mali TaxID=1618 RepID=UPI0026554539|nr:MerR family transcriptional regulator [Liquorilactobacillus mali]MDN7146510.1 MerR family transcriptional regulator [Liquorilactobacillus mali]